MLFFPFLIFFWGGRAGGFFKRITCTPPVLLSSYLTLASGFKPEFASCGHALSVNRSRKIKKV